MSETEKNQPKSSLVNEASESFQNPIDKDKITEHPHLLPYAHTVGSAVIKPIDKGRVKGLAIASMYEQTEMQLDQIREQVNLLVRQAQAIQDRVLFSEAVYRAEAGFKPLVGKIYHLYKNSEGRDVLSMIGPQEWGKRCPYDFQASMKLLSDHTWEVIKE
jgi:Protein of unknown function (DUF2452)